LRRDTPDRKRCGKMRHICRCTILGIACGCPDRPDPDRPHIAKDRPPWTPNCL